MTKYLIAAILIVFSLSGCSDTRTPTERYVEQLAEARQTENRTNDIFLGLEFGMRPKAFFDHCTELNQQQKIVEGADGKMAQFDLEGLIDEGTLSFAPKFSRPGPEQPDSSVLYAMNIKIKYKAWAPWNEDRNSLALLRDVTKVFIEKYDGNFLALPHDDLGRVVVQIDNNRRISLWRYDDESVYGRFVDLSIAPDDPLVPVTPIGIPNLTPSTR